MTQDETREVRRDQTQAELEARSRGAYFNGTFAGATVALSVLALLLLLFLATR